MWKASGWPWRRGWADIKGDASREEIADGGGILPCIFAFISGNSGFLDLFCPQQYEILYLGSDDEMSHLTAKNSQKHEVDGPQ